MIETLPAQTGDPLNHLLTLAQEYVTWMTSEIRVHYPALDLHEFTSEHTYDDLRKKFPGDHVPPQGCLLIAQSDGQTAGCIALGPLAPGIAELRTLYVRPAFRGLGVGKALALAALQQARDLGYTTVRLDTLNFMHSAQGLYHALGFTDIPPYLQLSPALQQYICFMELVL